MRNGRPGNIHIFTAVLTGSGNHRRGEGDGWKGLDATAKASYKDPDNTAATLGNHQLWQLCGVKIPRDPNCANAVMLWHLNDYLWEGCLHFLLCLQRSGNGWQKWAGLLCSVVHATLAGQLHLRVCWTLLALLTVQISEGRGASPCETRRLPRGEGTFLTAQSSGKKTSPLSFL